MTEYPYIYRWGNNPVRAALKGKRCRVVMSGTKGTVMLEFADGDTITTSRRALRRVKERKNAE